MPLMPAPRCKTTQVINKHVSIRPFSVIGYDCVHLPRADGGCGTAALDSVRPRCPAVCVRGEGKPAWIDGTAAGPTQL